MLLSLRYGSVRAGGGGDGGVRGCPRRLGGGAGRLSIVLPPWYCRGRVGGMSGVKVGTGLWKTSGPAGRRGVGRLPVSTARAGCPQVVHRVIHRMADLWAPRRVIHNMQVRPCARRCRPGRRGGGAGRGESYPQAEVIHRGGGLWKSHTPVDDDLSTGLPVDLSPRPPGPPRGGESEDTPPATPPDLTAPGPGRIFFMLMPTILPTPVQVTACTRPWHSAAPHILGVLS